MSNVQFITYKVSSVDFVNDMENGSKIEFEHKQSYSVRYSAGLKCVGEISVEANSKTEPDKFHIRVKLMGIFSFREGVKKEVIHRETYKELFPYVRMVVQSLSVNAGIPAIIIPSVNIDEQNIYRFEKNGITEE